MHFPWIVEFYHPRKVHILKYLGQLEELDVDEEESKDAVADLQPSFELFTTLKKENGRTGDDIFATILV